MQGKVSEVKRDSCVAGAEWLKEVNGRFVLRM